MDDVSAVMSWFSSPVYSRYWRHYQQAMAWHQRHRRAYRKALEAAYGPGYRQEQRPGSRRRYADRCAAESSSDSDIECDVSNMEISEELRQYFAQTEKHREELTAADGGRAARRLRAGRPGPPQRLVARHHGGSFRAARRETRRRDEEAVRPGRAQDPRHGDGDAAGVRQKP
ncbi:gem-associated protein 8 isoform X2 [Brachionichthys hirsutus]|uniref:gem-associated protein 8 isoform X2 n=1 Tax=Brachionichthys hirsutus TaxID=412623 RepID=UPI003604C596